MLYLSNFKPVLFAVLFTWIFGGAGCSTTDVTPIQPPSPPAYTQVPHPEGSDLGDISAIFTDPSAPIMPNFATNCDKDFKKLLNLTHSTEELHQGVRELVKNDPVSYHWCFYGKLMALETDLKNQPYVDERQKNVLETYQFLTPVAKSFVAEFHDSRYLRNAVYRYKKLSEWVFFRRLELTPKGTAELVQPVNPFGLWRKSDGGFSIIEKYHLQSSRDIASTGGATVTEGSPIATTQQTPSQPPTAPIPPSGNAPSVAQPPGQPISIPQSPAQSAVTPPALTPPTAAQPAAQVQLQQQQVPIQANPIIPPVQPPLTPQSGVGLIQPAAYSQVTAPIQIPASQPAAAAQPIALPPMIPTTPVTAPPTTAPIATPDTLVTPATTPAVTSPVTLPLTTSPLAQPLTTQPPVVQPVSAAQSGVGLTPPTASSQVTAPIQIPASQPAVVAQPIALPPATSTAPVAAPPVTAPATTPGTLVTPATITPAATSPVQPLAQPAPVQPTAPVATTPPISTQSQPAPVAPAAPVAPTVPTPAATPPAPATVPETTSMSPPGATQEEPIAPTPPLAPAASYPN